MKKRVSLAVDLGTGGAKSALVAEDASILASAFIPYPTHYPEPGFHEQEPEAWWQAVGEGSRAVIGEHRFDTEVVAVALSGQSLALVPVNDSFVPSLERVPIWSDARAAEQAQAYFKNIPSAEWYARTGNGFPAELYTTFKYAWYSEHRPETVQGARWLLGSKDWINARLTGSVATDFSYASGFGAYSLATHRYDSELLAAAGISEKLLPPVVASTDIVGTLTSEAAQHLGLPEGIPVVSGGVDNSCMALGAGLDRTGRTFLSLGSSNWLTIATPVPVLDDTHRPYVFEHVLPDLYISALSTFGGGSTLSWLAESFGVGVSELLDEAAAEPVGARGLVCVPTLAGGTVAEGGSDVRGSFVGLDLSHNRGTMARAVIEGIASSLGRTARLLADYVALPDEILAVGGGAQSPLLLQTLADVLGRRITRVENDQQSAALGAAALGFIGTGVWDSTEPLSVAFEAAQVFYPNSSNSEILTTVQEAFEAASVAASRDAGVLESLRDLSRNGSGSI